MSKGIIEQILEIAKNANNSERLIIFTNSFKAVGELYSLNPDTDKHILTLKNASVCNTLENFECAFAHHSYEWLNIVEDKIVAFSVTPK